MDFNKWLSALNIPAPRPQPKRARFDWSLVIGPDLPHTYVLLRDQDGELSVTNDVELVIEDLVAAGLAVDEMRVIYRDNEGRWDGIETQHGRFQRFLELGATSAPEAIQKWQEIWL